MNLSFRPLDAAGPGVIFNLLDEAYRNWPRRAAFVADWKQYDAEAFANPETVGRCLFLTFENDHCLGFASWDPRQHPLAIIGHHCVRPSEQGRGIGTAQLQHLIRHLADQQFTEAEVTTGQEAFFAPARKLYTNTGFIRQSGNPRSDGTETITYRRRL